MGLVPQYLVDHISLSISARPLRYAWESFPGVPALGEVWLAGMCARHFSTFTPHLWSTVLSDMRLTLLASIVMVFYALYLVFFYEIVQCLGCSVATELQDINV